MRGKDQLTKAELVKVRITPAYAGKSFAYSCYGAFNRDHPRVCGEKRLLSALRTAGKGSPPRMRGKARLTAAPYQQHGITPAYAGKSDIETTNTDTDGDHPRVCGEKVSIRQAVVNSRGSPPRMRGKEKGSPDYAFAKRITPAYAGKSHAALVCGAAHSDHPRVCGEKPIPHSFVSHSTGSPPRMRGKV